MAIKPILFSGPMVRALLDGRKTMDRRVLKPQPPDIYGMINLDNAVEAAMEIENSTPYAPGDMLYCRETFYSTHTVQSSHNRIYYRADCDELTEEMLGFSWRPSTNMPRWASRLTLEVTAVKVERVQDISEEDARAEGCRAHGPGLCTENPDDYMGCYSARTAFRKLWNALNESRGHGWDVNPWCAAISFKVHHANVDTMKEAA